MLEYFARTELLLGREAMEKLSESKVLVFGVGGVGGYVIEALARSGIGALDIVDNDVVSVSNINRQIIATKDTIGKLKTEVMKERIALINPECKVRAINSFFLPENSADFDFASYDYVVDAIDTVTGKIEIVVKCNEVGTKVISSMGTGNKLNPTQLEVADIYKTSVCPLAKVMRKELKDRGIKKLKVVYSKEIPLKPLEGDKEDTQKNVSSRRATPGSVSFVPPVAGMIIASEVIKDLIGR